MYNSLPASPPFSSFLSLSGSTYRVRRVFQKRLSTPQKLSTGQPHNRNAPPTGSDSAAEPGRHPAGPVMAAQPCLQWPLSARRSCQAAHSLPGSSSLACQLCFCASLLADIQGHAVKGAGAHSHGAVRACSSSSSSSRGAAGGEPPMAATLRGCTSKRPHNAARNGSAGQSTQLWLPPRKQHTPGAHKQATHAHSHTTKQRFPPSHFPTLPQQLTVGEGDVAADGHPSLKAHRALDSEGGAVEEGGHRGGQALQLVDQPEAGSRTHMRMK